ncbi:MAG: hypothetical protein NZM13_06605 [Cyclobacteriaceae bacterium]|nr:hypothetical protein [Cyclobacteriaceae bacterium]
MSLKLAENLSCGQSFVLLLATLVVAVSCNQRLNDEQRRELAEGRKKMEIRQIPQADLLKAGMDIGEKLVRSLPDTFASNEISRLSGEQGVAIRWYTPESPAAEPLLNDLMHAYSYTIQSASNLPSHIQRLGQDSVLFVKPVVHEKALKGMWCITMPVKKIVMEMPVE